MARFLGLGSGKNGVINLSSYTPLKYSCSGSSGSTSLSATGTFSAGDRLFIIQSRGTGVGNYEDNRVASYTSGTVTLVHPLENTYTDSGASQAQVLVVKEASSVTGSLTVSAWDGNVGGGFVMACSGTFSGTVNANGKGYRAEAALTSANQIGRQGEGHSAAGGTQSRSANGNGGGGGEGYSGSSRAGGGGGGGYAAAGSTGTQGLSGDSQTEGGLGGSSVGQAELTSLFIGGSGGGGGAGTVGGGGEVSGKGGDGGGFIVVYSKNISNTAQLTANGGSGTAPTRDGLAGGGGGAGGSVLIKSVSTAIGTSKITASAGSGGPGSGAGPIAGGNGSVGRIRIESCSLSGTTSPTASTQTGGHSYCGSSVAIL